MLMLPLLFITSCKEDDPEPAEDPIASFQYEIDEANYLLVTFTSFSENAATYSWNFGDNETSAEENPVHTYSAVGDYTVTLTATNVDGVAATKTETFTITNPDAALELLTGAVSKEWKLFRVGSALGLGPNAEDSYSYFQEGNDSGKRPCLFTQTFTFHKDGKFVFDDMGVFWGENDPFGTTDVHETCFEPTAANMVNLEGADVSAWGSGTHAFTYDPSNGDMSLTGMGAWIGFVHTVGNETYSNIPTVSRNLTVSIVQETGYDVMTVAYAYADLYWVANYVNYSDPSLEPAIVQEPVVVVCDPLASISPTEISHTFASNDAADWVLLQPSDSGSELTLGVDDPTDATAAKVGKYSRIEGVSYQELQFKLDPANAINFENLTTITMDVYLPSTNAYDAANLTDNVFIGFGATECPPDWYTDQHEYQETGVAKDTWVTLTYPLNDATYVAIPENGATVFDRNDLDMIYIAIGGGGHGVGADFYMRNFKIQ